MAAKSAQSKSPPQARLAFRVGIVGHRPDRLPKDAATLEALRRTLRNILEAVQTEVANFAKADRAKPSPVYAPDSPVLRAISPLAEGSDRMFAAAAIELGFELLCPMPFHQQEFEKDFLPPHALEDNSRDKFRALLERARQNAGLVTFELDGRRSAAGAAYGMAGRVVLNQADFLIAVWDRGAAAGSGGTVQTLREAVHFYVPVLWIDPFRPDQWRVLRTEQDIASVESGGANPDGPEPGSTVVSQSIATQINALVQAELAAPELRTEDAQVAKLSAREYFAERKPRLNFWFWWKIFRDLAGSGVVRMPKLVVPDFEAEVSEDWPIDDGIARSTALRPSAVEDWVNRRLRAHYAWADKLADWYADHYRSAYLAIYLLSAIAVLVAIVLHTFLTGAVLELALIAVIVALFVRGSRWHWHERWMEYRLLAELIRQTRILIPLGGGRPLPRTPAISIYESLTQTWMYWQMRAVARATGIPPVKITSEYLLDCVRYIGRVGDGQLQFHRVTRQRSESIALLLNSTAHDLFILSLCFVFIHLLAHIADHLFPNSKGFVDQVILVLSVLPAIVAAFIWLFFRSNGIFFILAFLLALGAATSFSLGKTSLMELFIVLAALPAFGAALASIANQGEFARLAKRSVAMTSPFEAFAQRVRELEQRLLAESGEPTTQLADVITLATEITQVMVDEVSDWRVVVAEQPMRVS
jgi:hypothetical protein